LTARPAGMVWFAREQTHNQTATNQAMRLFEAILEANHRALAGDPTAGLRPLEHADALPVAALTCVDPRLNPLIPEVLGIPEEQFIWLRNAGNVITGPLSSTMRSLALACAIKGAREIAVIGHTDCAVCKTPMVSLLERLKDLGVERLGLPDNLSEFFGLFASERQNVHRACELIRHSPLIGPRVPVHGLLVDIQTGQLEWLVHGYETWGTMAEQVNEVVRSSSQTVDKLKTLADFQIGEIKFPETQIGEAATQAADWLSQKLAEMEIKPPADQQAAGPSPTVVKLTEKVVEFADKHWPKPPAGSGQAAPPPSPPPGLRMPVPASPRGPAPPRLRKK